MRHKKILTVVLVVFFVWLISQALPVEAAKFEFTPNVSIPGTDFTGSVKIDGALAGKYIVALYTYGAGIAGLVAMFMLVLAGWKWLMAAGNAQKVASAKEMINGVLVGLALLFGGQLLLSQISKNLVIFEPISLKAIDKVQEDVQQCRSYFLSLGDEDSIWDCGSIYTTSSELFNGKQITCLDTRCPQNFVCRDTDNNMKLCDDLVVGNIPNCTCLSTKCEDIGFSGGQNNEADCAKYPTVEMCKSNACFGQAGMASICGQDFDNPEQVCELITDVRCEDNYWCRQSSSASAYCCEDSNGADYCRLADNIDCM